MKSVFLIFLLVAGGFLGSKNTFATSTHVNQELIIVGDSSSYLTGDDMVGYYLTDAQQGLLINNTQLVIMAKGENKTHETETRHYIVSVFPYLFYVLFIVGFLIALSLDDTKVSIAKRKQYQAN
jgi:hypothetical protein